MHADTPLNLKLKLRVYLNTVGITFFVAVFGTYYLIMSAKFPTAFIYHLILSVTGTVVIAMGVLFFVYDRQTRAIHNYFSKGSDVLAAYENALNFPFQYALACWGSYVFILVGLVVYMPLATGVDGWDMFDLVVAWFIAAAPAALLVYFRTQRLMVWVTRVLFQKSGIDALHELPGLRPGSVRVRLIMTLLVVAMIGFFAIAAYFLHMMAYLEIANDIFVMIVRDIGVILGYVVLITLAVAFMFSRNVTEPLSLIEGYMEEIAGSRGDLRRKADILSNDEIGRIGGRFNEFLQSMTKLVHEVRQSADKIAIIAEGMAASSEQVNASSEEITSAVNLVTIGAAQQLSQVQNIVSIAENIEQDATNTLHATESAEELIGSVVDAAMDGREQAHKSVENIGMLVIETNKSVRAIQQLNENVNQIGASAEAIATIASQTNLLALNAAIESARAGEHGSGFGVIAQEIRKLNDSTTQAANEIGQLIEDIIASTSETIDQIRHVSVEVTSGKETIETSSNILQHIAFSVDESKKAVDDISAMASSQRNSLKEAVQLIEEMARIAESTSTSAEEVLASSEQQEQSMAEMANSAQDLALHSDQLGKLVAQFKT